MRYKKLPLLALLMILISCVPKTDQTAHQRAIAEAVIATVANIPTYTPYPTYPPPPTLRPPLDGVFCEYGFCIGHPVNIPLYDLNVVEKGVGAPSAYSSGKLLGFQNDVAFITVFWVPSYGSWDPSSLIGTVLNQFGDKSSGSMDVELVGPLNIAIQLVEPSDAVTLRSALIASWRCGDRDFIWKAYTQSDAQAKDLLDEALKKFDCGE